MKLSRSISINQKSFYQKSFSRKTPCEPKFPLQKTRAMCTKRSISNNRRISKPLKPSSKNRLWQFQKIDTNEPLRQVFQRRLCIGREDFPYTHMVRYYNDMHQIFDYLYNTINAVRK